LGGYILRINYI